MTNYIIFCSKSGNISLSPKKPNQSALSTLNDIANYIRNKKPNDDEYIDQLKIGVQLIESNFSKKCLSITGLLYWIFGRFTIKRSLAIINETTKNIFLQLQYQKIEQKEKARKEEQKREREHRVMEKVNHECFLQTQEILDRIDKERLDATIFLKVALQGNNVSLLKELLKRGADPKKADADGNFPLFYAVTCPIKRIKLPEYDSSLTYYLSPSNEMVTLLLEYGAKREIMSLNAQSRDSIAFAQSRKDYYFQAAKRYWDLPHSSEYGLLYTWMHEVIKILSSWPYTSSKEEEVPSPLPSAPSLREIKPTLNFDSPAPSAPSFREELSLISSAPIFTE